MMNSIKTILSVVFVGGLLALVVMQLANVQAESDRFNHSPMSNTENLEKATFGGGCFWCIEAVFQRLKGVKHVVPGYAGGTTVNPTYDEVCGGGTGHAEVVQVHYDPQVISYEDLLYVFFRTHDPTTKNRQGNDVGPQYRSIILTHDDEQRQIAESVLTQTDKADVYDDPIVTEIQPLEKFYEAEDYHKDYYNRNRSKNPYCMAIIDPKIKKLQKNMDEYLKEPAK